MLCWFLKNEKGSQGPHFLPWATFLFLTFAFFANFLALANFLAFANSLALAYLWLLNGERANLVSGKMKITYERVMMYKDLEITIMKKRGMCNLKEDYHEGITFYNNLYEMCVIVIKYN